MKTQILFLGRIILIALLFQQCSTKLPQQIPDYEVAAKWADMTLYITQHTPANSPTFASRCLGYLGLTQYEAVVHGFTDHQSLVGQLNGLEDLPKPDPTKNYAWPLVLNKAQAVMLRSIYLQTSDENKHKIDSLEKHLEAILSQNITRAQKKASNAFGEALASALFEWSKTDGGHRGYLQNFDPQYTHKEFPGSWKPPLFAQSFSHHPLHPYWGKNRTFAPKNKNLPLPQFIPYDTLPGSPYYEQFNAVYQKGNTLTPAEKKTAIWWSDDPDVTFSPGGHLYYIANQLVRSQQPDLINATKTFAALGMSIADAFINCWKWKYHFFSERPNTFIPKFIDQKWESFWPDPPFPSFPSGHAIQAAAGSRALLSIYDNNTAFVDSAHVGRPRDYVRNTPFERRPFKTLWEVALETADSRFYGGIHTAQDNEVGLMQGKIIAENIIGLQWEK